MSRSPAFASSNKPKSPSGFLVFSVLAGVAALGLPAPDRTFGQYGGIGGQRAAAQQIKTKSPVASQVFQRDANGRATIPIELDESVKDAKVIDASAMPAAGGFGMPGAGPDSAKFVDGKLAGVPVGGPYTIALTIKKGEQ